MVTKYGLSDKVGHVAALSEPCLLPRIQYIRALPIATPHSIGALSIVRLQSIRALPMSPDPDPDPAPAPGPNTHQVGIMFVDDKERASGATQGKVDDEVRALLNDSYARAKKVGGPGDGEGEGHGGGDWAWGWAWGQGCGCGCGWGSGAGTLPSFIESPMTTSFKPYRRRTLPHPSSDGQSNTLSHPRGAPGAGDAPEGTGPAGDGFAGI